MCIAPPLAVCAGIAGFSLLLVYDTTAFFHTRGESLVAMILAWFAVGSHVLSLMSGRRMGVEGGGATEGVSTITWSSPSRGVFLAPFE